MSAIPKLTESEIKSYVGEKNFGRGKQYFHRGAIFESRKVKMTLKANCEGSQSSAYRVWVAFHPKGIKEAECSCPVGGGGRCKHVASLLLTWKAKPDEFVDIPDIDAVLSQRSKEELITLIKFFLKHQPELESLLELQFPVGQKQPVTSQVYKRQADMIFRSNMREWRGELALAQELRAIVYLGDEFQKKGEYVSALAVYQGLSDAIIDNLEMYRDEEGYVSEVVQDIVTRLSACLQYEKQKETREAILKTLFTIYRSDIEVFGGIGISDEIPDIIINHATKEETQTMIQWLHDASNNVKKDMREWVQKTYQNCIEALQNKKT